MMQFTEKKEAPPGFEFVPIGNPALTTACKELSREQDAMIFIVTVCLQLRIVAGLCSDTA